jgi:hypothetical protein
MLGGGKTLGFCCSVGLFFAFVGLGHQGKDIVVFRFIIEYNSSSLSDFGS